MTDWLNKDVTREARDALARWLHEQAEEHANGSRDFGRGFAHAIRVLERAPAFCYCCNLPQRAPVGQWVNCIDCGRRWYRDDEISWVPA